MLFTFVIFSTYKFFQGSLAIAKLALAFFTCKNDVVFNSIELIYIDLSKIKNIFLLKEHIFTSPQLKITLFKTVLIQLTFDSNFFDIRNRIGSQMCQSIKRENHV